MFDFFSITLTLFFVIDALGNIPGYVSLFKHIDKKKRQWIAVRELLIALLIMLFFHFFGEWLLSLLSISASTVSFAGGIILFLISIRLIFSEDEKPSWDAQKPPFIVPIATPMIAGPSVLSIIMIFAQGNLSNLIVLGAIVLAWFLSAIIFLLAGPILKLIKEKGLNAAQRLMGLIVAMIAVQLFIEGLEGLFKK